VSDLAQPRFKTRAIPQLRIDHLWILIVLAGIGVWIALVPTPPNDFWWHLKAGRIVATEGLPQTNMFAWTLPADQPFIYATWLGEWLFYQLYQWGGLALVVIARNLMGLTAFAFVAIDAWRRSDSWRLAALATLIAAGMTLNNLIIRTQNWSWIPFGLYVVILSAYAGGRLRPRSLLVLPPIMAFWVNAHGAFVLGLIMLAIYAAGETVRRLLKQPRMLSWKRVRALYLALLGALAATLINPLGPGIFGYVVKLLTDPPSQDFIVEWQPPTPQGIAGFIFYVAILLLIAALAYARRKPNATDLLLICAFLWQAWNGQRYVVWFGMVAMPILAQCLAAPRDPLTVPLRRARNVPVNTAIALGLLLALTLAQPPFKAQLPFPETYRSFFADVPGAPLAFDTGTPVAATEYLRANPIDGRLFNEMGYGSYLAWALYPQVQVFVDPRVELYPRDLWEDYIAITEARDYNSLLIDKYNVSRVMLNRTLQPKLAEAMRSDPRWEREYADEWAEIYRRVE
jgi:hypothetical protein